MQDLSWCHLVPRDVSELQKRIRKLKKQRKALLLAHNYQPLEIQEVADFVGDSLQLAKKSASVEGDCIRGSAVYG
jgi:quinolinate synthase